MDPCYHQVKPSDIHSDRLTNFDFIHDLCDQYAVLLQSEAEAEKIERQNISIPAMLKISPKGYLQVTVSVQAFLIFIRCSDAV